MIVNKLGYLFGKFAGCFNLISNMFFLDIETFVSNIKRADKGDHFIKDTSAFIDGHIYVDLFFAYDWTGVDTKIAKVKISKFFFKHSNSGLNISILIMKEHCNDIVG